MRAYLEVLDHPYFSVTGRDGSFRFADVPQGELTLAVWHERLGARQVSVTVHAQRTTTVELRLTATPSG
jgi:hypothetical protein